MTARKTRPSRQPKPPNRPSRPQQQGGVALIMVLLVVAVVSVIATEISGRIQFEIQKAQNRQMYQQSYWYAQGAERLARGLIELAKKDPTIHLDQAWANPFLSYPIDGGSMSIQIIDQQTCFNLNALSTLTTAVGGSAAPPLIRRQLVQLLDELDVDLNLIPELIEPLLDWIDSDTLPSGLYGAEDLHYSALTPAYQPANGPLSDTSELNLIDGFGWTGSSINKPRQQLTDQLRPFLCALPSSDTVLNLNTLKDDKVPLLAAIFESTVPPADLLDIIENRPDDGFADVDEFWGQLPAPAAGAAPINPAYKNNLSVNSDFFLARIQVRYYDTNLILFSQIAIKADQPITYRRRYGAPNE